MQPSKNRKSKDANYSVLQAFSYLGCGLFLPIFALILLFSTLLVHVIENLFLPL